MCLYSVAGSWVVRFIWRFMDLGVLRLVVGVVVLFWFSVVFIRGFF